MPEWISTAEAAEVLGVTTRQVARLVENDKLKPELKMPGLRGAMVFKRTDVERYARKRNGR